MRVCIIPQLVKFFLPGRKLFFDDSVALACGALELFPVEDRNLAFDRNFNSGLAQLSVCYHAIEGTIPDDSLAMALRVNFLSRVS